MFSIILINFIRPHTHRLLIEIIFYFDSKLHLEIIFVCSLDGKILKLGIFHHITNYAMGHYQRKLPRFVEKILLGTGAAPVANKFHRGLPQRPGGHSFSPGLPRATGAAPVCPGRGNETGGSWLRPVTYGR